MRALVLLLLASSASAQDCDAVRREAAEYAAAFLADLRDNPTPTERAIAEAKARMDEFKRRIAECEATQSGK